MVSFIQYFAKEATSDETGAFLDQCIQYHSVLLFHVLLYRSQILRVLQYISPPTFLRERCYPRKGTEKIRSVRYKNVSDYSQTRHLKGRRHLVVSSILPSLQALTPPGLPRRDFHTAYVPY